MWHDDGIEEGEQCWYVFLNEHIQLQLLARTTEEVGKFKDYRLFIERDTRQDGARVYYSGQTWNLTEEESKDLLTLSRRRLIKKLKKQIVSVMLLPNMPEYCFES